MRSNRNWSDRSWNERLGRYLRRNVVGSRCRKWRLDNRSRRKVVSIGNRNRETRARCRLVRVSSSWLWGDRCRRDGNYGSGRRCGHRGDGFSRHAGHRHISRPRIFVRWITTAEALLVGFRVQARLYLEKKIRKQFNFLKLKLSICGVVTRERKRPYKNRTSSTRMITQS